MDTSAWLGVGEVPLGGLAEVILSAMDAPVVVLDAAGLVQYLNAAGERWCGRSLRSLRGQPWWPAMVPADELPGVLAVGAAGPGRVEHHWVTAGGERRVVLWSRAPVPDWPGVGAQVLVGVDVTVERRSVAAREARFQALFEQSADGVVLLDPNDPLVRWRIVECNEAFARMNGYAREELIGQPMDLLHDRPVLQQATESFLRRIRLEGTARGEHLHRRKDGTELYIESASSLAVVDGRELVLGVDRDVTQRKRTELNLRTLSAQLAHEAQHDPLTGLANRALLMERLDVALARVGAQGSCVAVVFCDLDDFKRVNDTLGHPVGDAVLQAVGARLLDAVRPGDTVSRPGGDEFVLVLPDLRGAQDVTRMARRLQRALAKPFTVHGQAVRLGVSLGVSVAPTDGLDGPMLLAQADRAMYLGKREGKNALRFFR